MRLVALNGLIGSGKSSVAAHLVSQHGFTLVKFAGSLKAMLRAFLCAAGADGETIERMIEGDLKEVPSGFLHGKAPRWAMQSLGTEWGRTCIGAQVWIHAAVSRVRAELEAGHSVVVDDCRFLNEATALRDLGAEVWRVTRPDILLAAHPSEFEQLHVTPDRTLLNSGTVTDLHWLVDGIMLDTLTTAPEGSAVLA